LGLEEYANREGVMVIEWADKFIQFIPEPRWDISIRVISENEREILMKPIGHVKTNLENILQQFISMKSGSDKR
jgi:tRNA A37 threonylcarbamoyladenosine biosynthesis protein TsaE